MVVSASPGTAEAGIRPDRQSSRRGATAVAEGLSRRATARLLGGEQDPANHWVAGWGRHGQGVLHDCFRNLQLPECQGEELWPCIDQTEAHLTPLEKWRAGAGEAWVWMAFSPVCQWVPAWGVGTRTWRPARRLLVRLPSATAGHLPVVTSAALPPEANALLEVSGVWGRPLRHGPRGRVPQLSRTPPPDWCDAVVGKERAQGRVVNLTTRRV